MNFKNPRMSMLTFTLPKNIIDTGGILKFMHFFTRNRSYIFICKDSRYK